MNKEELLKLQNGSDIRGVAIHIPGKSAPNLTAKAINCIAQGFLSWVTEKTGKEPSDIKIAIGRDSRLSGQAIAIEISTALSCFGCSVYDCGMASTPAMFMSLIYEQAGFDASIMITASHLPYERNGMKFFTKEGGLDKGDITYILEEASLKEPLYGENNAQNFDLMSLYTDDLCNKIKQGVNHPSDYDHPLSSLKIVVDAGNGMGGFFATDILSKLGADINGSQFLEPNGHFPNHVPNPEDKEAMSYIKEATVKSGADLGLIFDTDVDRMSAVLSDGTVINRDALIAMMAAILAPDNPHSTIVTDSVTSDRLTDFLENTLSLKHLSFKRGYKNVINKCRQLNEEGINSPLAIETSGHGALKENYYLDDGAYQAVKLVIALAKSKREGKKLHDLIKDLSTDYYDMEIRFNIDDEDFASAGAKTLDTFKKNASAKGYKIPDTFEGVRISIDENDLKGWALLRASLHDPVLVLNAEGRDLSQCEKIVAICKEIMH